MVFSTPNAKVEMIELRNVIGPFRRSEKRSVNTTRYNDTAVIKTACALDIPLKQVELVVGMKFTKRKHGKMSNIVVVALKQD